MSNEPEDQARVLALIRGDQAAHAARLDALAQVVDQLIADRLAAAGERELLARLTEQVAALTGTQEAGGAAGPVWNWNTMTADQATRAWTELLEWIDGWLLPAHPGADAPEHDAWWSWCWYLHPDALHPICALYGMWRQAYTGKTAAAPRVAEWWNRWLPDTQTRLRTVLGTCNRTGEHRVPPPAQTSPEQQATRRAHINADIARRPTD